MVADGVSNEEILKAFVEAVITSMKRLRPRQPRVREEIRKTIDYFQTNAERMRYAEFRRQGLFVGSGVVEAGCKTIIGLRLKQPGMRWTVRGALRCCQLSGRLLEHFPRKLAMGKIRGTETERFRW